MLELLNLSHNQLINLPAGLARLSKLRKLFINDNQITFTGLPSGVSRLNDLEVFNASNNLLENIPEGMSRVFSKIKKNLLILHVLKDMLF